MALTLVEAGKTHATNGEFKKAGITMAFASGHPIVAVLPAVNVQGNAYSWNEEAVLPSVAARAVGENYTASEGKFTLRTEPLKIYGGTLQVDRVITKTLGEERRSEHEALKAKALGQALGFDLYEGGVAAGTTKAIAGLRVRYPITNTTQVIDNNAACSMAEVDQLIELVSMPTHLVMSRVMARNINVFLRASGTAVRMEKDAFGRPLMFYNDIPIIISDPVDVASGYQALSSTNADNGDDDANQSSIFCISATPSGLHLIQNGGMEIEDLGVTDEGTSRGTLVEWIVGLADEGPRSVARYARVTTTSAVVA